jgi:hypothetical protein
MTSSRFSEAHIETPVVSDSWRKLTHYDRLKTVMQVAYPAFEKTLEVTDVKSTGEVIVRLTSPIPASERGMTLLNFESQLKSTVDEGLCVWVEPLGDKNSLRRLRGIQVTINRND